MLNNLGRAIHAIFMHLASPNPGPILIHCTAGKDRTGVIVMVLLLLAGCSPDTVAAEYSLTEIGLGDAWRAETASRLAKHIANLGVDLSGIERMVSTRKEVMLAVIQNLKKDYGGVEGYLAAVNVDDDQVHRVQKVLQEAQVDEERSMENV